MKKRNQARRRRHQSRGFLSGNRPERKRRAWTFEQLEARHFMSATPLSTADDLQLIAISSNTLEGKALIELLNQQWLTQSLAGGSNLANLPAGPRALPTDPYFQFQWNLFNTGQVANYEDIQNIFGVPGEDINVVPVWESGITGQGVLIAVVDTGIATSGVNLHSDLASQLSGFSYNALTDSTNTNPGSSGSSAHGTAVAGIIAAAANGQGVVGIAYGAKIVPIKLLPTSFADPELTEIDMARAIAGNGLPIDIFNHSWGPSDLVRSVSSDILFFDPLNLDDADLMAALATSATQGRNGLGAIHIFASGNGAGPISSAGFQDIGVWDSAGSDAFVNSRYTIGVGAVDHDGSVFNADGTFTLYGEVGPSVLIVAPTASGPFDVGTNTSTGSGVWTTDLPGNNGANFAGNLDGDDFPDTDYTSTFNGTSASAPHVSGVVALMLDANPNLSYRDVQEILVRSARQNDDFDSSWVTNLFSLFRDPISHLEEDPQIPGSHDEIRYEIVPPADPEGEPEAAPIAEDLGYNPILDPRYSTLPEFLPTNGAGYTVSHGRMAQFASEYGYAHGVVDAALAVELAQQWHLKGQNLANELTYLTIPQFGTVAIQAGATSSEESGEVRIPGGLGVDGDGFLDYFEEFFKEPTVMAGDSEADPPTMDMFDPESLPFGGEDPPENDRGGFISVQGPSGSNAMSVEWVEVQLDISGGGDAMDFLRITLVSPDGVHSELTNYQMDGGLITDNFQFNPVNFFTDPPGQLDDDLDGNGVFSWIYSTNRNWGERGEGQWQLHFENYSGQEMSLDGARIVFHGKPVGVTDTVVHRVTGSVGVDTGRAINSTDLHGRQDGFFNFDRTTDIVWDDSNQTFILPPHFSENWLQSFARYATTKYETAFLEDGEIIQYFDPLQEEFASNITVVATDVASGQIVSRFVTGADGNYIFDLPAGVYLISMVDPEGRDLEGNSSYLVTVPDLQQVQNYHSFNFLLDPGPLPPNEVVMQGQVFADLDGDGVEDPVDAGIGGFLVYVDLNNSGQREASEPFVLSDQNGNYSLPIATVTNNTFTIGVEPREGWFATAPDLPSLDVGFYRQYAVLGQTVTDLDFGVKPPSEPTEMGNGNVFGFVFDDLNGDGMQQSQFGELGAPGILVYIDVDTNGEFDEGIDQFIYTNANGAFVFDVAPGTYQIRVNIELPLTITAPTIGYREVTLIAGEVVQGATFGIQNLAINDFGDLVGAGFRTTLAQDGPRHLVVPGFQLGGRIDAEMDTNTIEDFEPTPENRVPNPALHGIGDDLVGPEDDMDMVLNDEDGVSIVGDSLRAGANTFEFVLNGVGGYLNAWIDLNDDGDFDDTVNGISEHVIDSIHRNTGTHEFVINAQAGLDGGADGKIAARFRWGSFGIDYFGADTIGEVEDYLFEVSDAILGDYNSSGYVDEADFQTWRSQFGNSVAPGSGADGNANGVVDSADYTIWRDNFGAGTPPDGGAGSGSAAVLAQTQDSQDSFISSIIRTSISPSANLPGTHYSMAELLAIAYGTSTDHNAWLQEIGATSVVVSGPNGFHTRYGYSPSLETPSAPTTNTSDPTESQQAQHELATSLAMLGTRFSARFELTSTFVTAGPTTISAALTSGASLSLLDDVLAQLTSFDDDSDDDSLVIKLAEEDEDVAEIALAAVFDEEENWRLAI